MCDEAFQYPDTNSIRAGIGYMSAKFKNQKIAIVGLGGTGSYILDHVAKTCVKEIHLYDEDDFQLHNAFRAPGATAGSEFDVEGGLKKVDYYYRIYSQMKKGIVPHCQYITAKNIQQLAEIDYVFISVDKNAVRKMITDKLVEMKVNFIDTGLGVDKVDENLLGTIRVTSSTEIKNDHLKDRIGSAEFEENEYRNIQISELNCLNSVLAIIKWKKLSGFYQDLKQEHNSLFLINTNKIINEDFAA
jgi:tRNA A37 threonylcarbamoyladenosine dehydratase